MGLNKYKLSNEFKLYNSFNSKPKVKLIHMFIVRYRIF